MKRERQKDTEREREREREVDEIIIIPHISECISEINVKGWNGKDEGQCSKRNYRQKKENDESSKKVMSNALTKIH